MEKGQTLDKLHKVETEMIAKFDEVCRKHDIKYFVVFGTALGAVRHKGFIPWDDDVDIGMLREDYEKLKMVDKEEFGDIALVNPEDDCIYHEKVFPELYKKGTVFVDEYSYKYDEARNGKHTATPIWVDIFIYDRVNSKLEALWKIVRSSFLKKKYHFAKFRVVNVDGDSFIKRLSHFIKRQFHGFLNKKQGAEYRIYKKYTNIVKREKGKYIVSFSTYSKKEIYRTLCLYDDAMPLKRIKFEDIEVYIQNNYEEMLTTMYGDYMTPPPEDKRYAHIPYIIDFGEGEVADLREVM